MKHATVAAVLAAGFAGSIHAERLNYASPYPPGSLGAQAADAYAESLEKHSEGAMNMRVFPMSLLNFAEASAGVRDGIADGSFVATAYFSGEYPTTNMLGELSMLLELTDDRDPDLDGLAFAGAMSEYVMTRCEGCQQEFDAQNQLFLGGSSSPAFYPLCRTEIREKSDLHGKRLRTSGAQWARWASDMGATPISMTVNEVYEGLSQGALDCVIISLPELISFQLLDVVSDITLGVPGGGFGSSSPSAFNRERWEALRADQRQALLKASAAHSAVLSWLYVEGARDGLQQAKEQGIAIHEADAELVNATRGFIREDVEGIAQRYRERHGIENSEAMIEEFREVVDRWIPLVQEIESAEQLKELYWEQVFSHIDVDTY